VQNVLTLLFGNGAMGTNTRTMGMNSMPSPTLEYTQHSRKELWEWECQIYPRGATKTYTHPIDTRTNQQEPKATTLNNILFLGS